MKRIQEKVKDIVEVRAYKNLQDFISDPAETLSIYHFTDATSDMMSKWLDKVADVTIENGAAVALAGYRGVGKSHFLATLGAIVSQPELRSKITDQHVAASAQALKRRHYPIAYVRRGTHDTLFDELKDAIARTFNITPSSLGSSLRELMQMAAEHAGDLPFVLIIDTAFERASRVARDDGVFLGELAEIGKDLNIFIGVALDDDISGADGVNSAIARNFSIDYLDTEHLYKVVDAHVFPKNRQLQPLLHDIYTNFREVLPHFRWSEQRFTALYPLHPVILENAPFIRFFVPDFALLGFASEAGNKILGRPANSLIALDEVFDTVESSLRKIEDLKDAFETYDKINSEVVAKIPVLQRLQAKLVLKGLMLLSLEGDGTTAGEISASMLIFDEDDPPRAYRMVEDLLESFSDAYPEAVGRLAEEGRETRYTLKVRSKDNLNTALNELTENIPADVIPKILKRFSRERFSDWTLSDTGEASVADWMDCQVVWRGGYRRGRLIWDFENRLAEINSAPADFIDWEVVINHEPENLENKSEVPQVFWVPAQLRADEIQNILRYYILATDMNLREEFPEQVRTSAHAHAVLVEKIWKRAFLDEARLVIDGFDYNFTEEARSAPTLADLFTNMLVPLFETHYPEHPHFADSLGMTEVSALVNDLFSGARQNLGETQKLAREFALPLGLVNLHGDTYIPETEENLLNLPLVGQVMQLVEQSGDETVSLKTIYRELKKSPIGLVREAQHLILTALVAQRQIEFVTSKGDRINRRSLDLKIIWDDIEGVAKPSTVLYEDEKLIFWAQTLTGADSLKSIDTPEERANIRRALEIWLDDWKDSSLLERFDELPDELLNTKMWRIGTQAEKTFGLVAQTIGGVLDETISLEEGLHRITDAFSDSEKEFYARTKDLVVLEDFINGTSRREKVWTYLAVCETTQDEKIEFFREKLLQIIDESYYQPNETLNREMDNLWQSFHTRYTEHFAIKHDMVMKSHHLQEKFDEIMRSDDWWEFENLSRLSVFPKNDWRAAQKICRQFKELDCRFEVREMLKTHPFCVCSFSLEKIQEWDRLPQTLQETVSRGRESYRKVLQLLSQTIIQMVNQFKDNCRDEEFFSAAAHLIEIFSKGDEIPLLTNNELIVLQKIFESLPTSLLLNIDFPIENNFLSREEIRAQMNAWLDKLPDEPVLLKI